MSTALQLTPQQPQQLSQWKSPSMVKQRINAIQDLMKEALKPASKESGWDGDYGVIPGTGNKPSLLKSGSEQILAMFEIAVDPVVEDLSTEDCARYRVTCRLLHAPSGNFLGAGVGEASTNETKYKWKRTYSLKEFEATDPERRKIKHSQYKNSNNMWEDKEEWLIRQEPADLANTVLKMAKKRAQIDATLTVTGASSMFSQDEDTLEEAAQTATSERPKATRGRKPVQTTPKPEPVICADCRGTNSHALTCKHHPNNQSSTGQPAASKSTPKQEAKGELVAKETSKMVMMVKEVAKLQKKKGGDYLALKGIGQNNQDLALYVWHKHLMEAPADLSTTVNKMCVFQVSTSTSGDKTYLSAEHVLQIGEQIFQDDQPVLTGINAQQVGFEPEGEDPDWP